MARIFPHMARVRTLGRYAVGIGLWIPALIFFADNVASFHLVRGPSMSPTTLSRDFVFVRRWRATEDLRRGQVVLFRSPVDPEKVAIKRIFGLEGDVIKPRKPACPHPVLVTVPQGKVWVEGDEGFHSMDSNDYGPIPKALITARVTHVVWPPSRAGRVGEQFSGRYGALVHKASD